MQQIDRSKWVGSGQFPKPRSPHWVELQKGRWNSFLFSREHRFTRFQQSKVCFELGFTHFLNDLIRWEGAKMKMWACDAFRAITNLLGLFRSNGWMYHWRLAGDHGSKLRKKRSNHLYDLLSIGCWRVHQAGLNQKLASKLCATSQWFCSAFKIGNPICSKENVPISRFNFLHFYNKLIRPWIWFKILLFLVSVAFSLDSKFSFRFFFWINSSSGCPIVIRSN